MISLFCNSGCGLDDVHGLIEKQAAFIQSANTYLSLPAEILEAFKAALLHDDLKLMEKTYHYHQLLFHPKDESSKLSAIKEIIDLEAQSERRLSMLIPLILLSALPHTIDLYTRKGIPLDTMSATLADLVLNMKHYKDQHGIWGCNKLGWLLQHFSAEIFWLGRLQYQYGAFSQPIHVFRHRYNRVLAIFSGAGVSFRSDGKVDGTNDVYSCSWVTQFVQTDEHISGYPITSSGIALPELKSLPAGEWECVLQQGDPILNVHIPGGSKLSYELCQASYARAVAFFNDYFPEKEYKGFSCETWLLGPQFTSLMPASSNIIKFANDYHRFPILSNELQALERVFGKRVIDLATAPRDTQLQRIVVDYLMEGNQLHNGAGFMLKEEIINDRLRPIC